MLKLHVKIAKGFLWKDIIFTAQTSFPLTIFSVNVTESLGNCTLGHIYWTNPKWKTSFFVQWKNRKSEGKCECVWVCSENYDIIKMANANKLFVHNPLVFGVH